MNLSHVIRLARVGVVGLMAIQVWASAFRPSISTFLRERWSSHRFCTIVQDMTGWTVGRALKETAELLEKNNVAEPAISVQHLLAASLEDLSWEKGYQDILKISSREITNDESQQYQEKLKRRLQHEPLQYILGQWDFLEYTVTVRIPLLCPRPETEELVMRVVGDSTESPIHVLDVGCGTGVIGLALAEKLPDATVEAIDIDPVAVRTSMENARRILNPSQLSSYQVSLCAVKDFNPNHPIDIVVSNPPYIPESDRHTLSTDVIKYESDLALFSGEDGMDVIREIVCKLSSWCNSGAVCWMEVDPSHPAILQQWLEIESFHLGVEFEATIQDMFGKNRFVKLRVL